MSVTTPGGCMNQQPIKTLQQSAVPRDPVQALLLHRLQMTNGHCRNVATILEHYSEECKRAGLLAASKAITTAVGELYVVARLNDRAITSLEKP